MKTRLELKKAAQNPKEEIHFFRGMDKRVIGRVSSGKIAMISYDYKGQWVNDGDDWLCEIIREDENKAIVMPISMVKSAKDNYNESVKLAQELKVSGFKKEFFKPKDSTSSYIS